MTVDLPRKNSSTIVGAFSLLLAAGSAGGVGIERADVETQTGGTLNVGFWQLTSSNCTVTKVVDPGTDVGRGALVQGSYFPCTPNSDPGAGGYIELGDDQATVWNWTQRLIGKFGAGALGGIEVKFESLVKTDWESGAYPSRLVDHYISDAIAANCNGERPENYPFPGKASLLAALSDCFLNGDVVSCSGKVINPPPAQYASDPGISFANEAAAQITIGLVGVDDANDNTVPTIGDLDLVCPAQGVPPNQWQPVSPLRLSEVVKASYRLDGTSLWSAPQYLYGFAPIGTAIGGELWPWYNSVYQVSLELTDLLGFAGIDVNNDVFYTTDREGWIQIPGKLSTLITGDFDNDGVDDLAGLGPDGRVFYTTDLMGWVNIPGALSKLIAADLNGDGFDELVGIASDRQIFYVDFASDPTTWKLIPGRVDGLLAADLDGTGSQGILGLVSVTGGFSVYYTDDYGQGWSLLPGVFETLMTGDLEDDGSDGLLGLAGGGQVFYSNDKGQSYTVIPGVFSSLTVGDLDWDGADDLIGLAGGNVYYTTDFGVSYGVILGNFNQIVKGDLGLGGYLDPVTLDPATPAVLDAGGETFYSPGLQTWSTANSPALTLLTSGSF